MICDKRAPVGVVGVGVGLVPLDGVVGRVVHAAGALAAEPEVQCRQRQVLQERREVGARAERRDAERRIRFGGLAIRFRLAENRALAGLFEHRLAGARIHHVLRNLAEKLLQAVRAAGAEPALPGAVGVDVDRGLLLQLGVVLLRPLGRSEQAPLFAVPQRQLDGALRAPAALQHLRQATRGLDQSGGAADRIVGAAHPRIVVIAEDDPFVGARRARNGDHHVVERTVLPLERQLHVHLRRAGAEVIGHRQRAAPFLRRDRALRAA